MPLNGHNLLPLVLDQVIDLGFVLLREFLDLLFALLGFVFGDDAAFFFGLQDFVGIAAGVADGDFGVLGETLGLANQLQTAFLRQGRKGEADLPAVAVGGQ